MVSADIINVNPTTMSETERKSLKKRIISSLSFFKDKKKDRCKNETQKERHDETKKEDKTNPVDKILENLQKLEIEEKKVIREEEDESEFFCFKSIEEDGRSERIDSHSSEDSGFVDTKEVIEGLKDLKIDNEEKKSGEKKKQIVVMARKPTKTEKSYKVSNKPYDAEEACRQIRQINRKTLTGGQVLVNSQTDNYSEVDRALNSVKEIAQTSQQEQGYWEDVQDLIDGAFKQKDPDFLSGFFTLDQQNFEPIAIVPTSAPECNPIEEFSCANHLNYEDTVDVSTILNLDHMKDLSPSSNIFPTPPRSENVPSPISESQASYYPSNSDYTLSPELSPVYYSDYEKYQDLTGYGSPNSMETDKSRDRSASISSMKMKQFKDLQKEIAAGFSKMDCCEVMRKSCKEILQEHISKLDAPLRRKMCIDVSQMDLKTCYGVMHHILLGLSKSGKDEDLQYALFGLICERVLAQKPALFADDFGLSILKSAALRCPGRPFLTRCIVQAIRTALKSNPALYAGKDCIFTEVDLQGDTLLSACARAGDSFALVLSEITRNDNHGQPALFNVHHLNTEGLSALHLCCSLHSKQSPHIHTAHVLLEHSGADLQQGDAKGGDTPIHLAVNSANCDLHLVLLLFKTVDRKAWKNLAYLRNRSFVSPFDYARSAAKSTTRQNYPPEILDFFKKCR